MIVRDGCVFADLAVAEVTKPVADVDDSLIIGRSGKKLRKINDVNGTSWSWNDEQVVIVPAYTPDGCRRTYGWDRNLGVPRMSGTGRIPAYTAVADWLVEIGVKSVCGQVLSGAQMAFAVSLCSEGAVYGAFVSKDGYKPRKHYGFVSVDTPYAVIDDIVSSGEALGEVITEIMKHTYELPRVILASTWSKERIPLLEQVWDRMYAVIVK